MQSLGLPRLGRGTKGLLAALGVFGIGTAIATNLLETRLALWLMCLPERIVHGEVWRLLTATFTTDPNSLGHLLFAMVAVYFLGPEVERRWGSARLVRYFVGTSAFSYLFATLVSHFTPGTGAILHPPMMFGPDAAITALAIAWGNANPTAVIRLFFFLPVTGRAFTWITVGLTLLSFVYPRAAPEGPMTLLMSSGIGLLLGSARGEPSPLRRTYLEWKLALLRREKRGVSAMSQLKLPSRPPPPKGKGPILRVVRGEESKPPPKDKRWLN